MISNALYGIGLLAFLIGALVDIYIENKTEYTAHVLDLIGLAILAGSVAIEVWHGHN
jgi:hypothetical protein